MEMLNGKKMLLMVINELMTQDPDNHLTLEDHVFNTDTLCVTCIGTKRSVQLKEGLFRLDIDYLSRAHGTSKVVSLSEVNEVENMVKRIFDYLNTTTEVV